MRSTKFKLSRLALCVGLATAPAMAFSAVDTDNRTHVVAEAKQHQATYVVTLSQKSEWLGGNHSKIEAAQQRVISAAKTHSGTQILSRHTRAVNIVEMSLSEEAVEALTQLDDVAQVLPRFDRGQATAQHTIKKVTPAVEMAQVHAAAGGAMSADPDAGKGVKVAIISTGVDYTHEALGGDGDYAQANENAMTAYEGFPTETVIAGRDFFSEAGWGADENPLDNNLRVANSSGFEYPMGRGTALASIVHTLAPGAKLMAYKVSSAYLDPYDGSARMGFPSISTMTDAVELAVADGADVILVDHTVYGYDFAGHYDPNDSSPSPASLDIMMMQAAAAKGVVMVTGAGTYGMLDSKYNVSWLGAGDDVIAVGGVETEGESLQTAIWTPHGPVRGGQTIKPDLVEHYSSEEVAVVATATELEEQTAAEFAPARIAAAAAIVKSARPELSNLEVKAVIANTANSQVIRGGTDKNASVTQIGGGVANVEAAVASPVIAWEKDSNQPHLKFGHQVTDSSTQVIKEVVLRNYSDKAQTYTVAIEINAGSDTAAAISWEHPETVTIPAKSSITVPMVMNVDGMKLPETAMIRDGAFGIDNWEKLETSGYVVLAQEAQPQIHLGWSVMPRYQGGLKRHFETFREYFGNTQGTPWLEAIEGRKMMVSNQGRYDMTLHALPVMQSRHRRPLDKVDTNNLLKHVAGGVFDEASCTVSGKKMTLVGQMHAPMDLSVSNHMEKIGEVVFYFTIFKEETVEKYEFDKGAYDNPNILEEEYIDYGWVSIDENGQPTTVVIDLNKAFDPMNPTGRYVHSKLPTYFVPGSDTVMANICLEEMYHHDVDSVDDFDENLGFIFATDRDAMPDYQEPIIEFNPMISGQTLTVTGYDWFGNPYEATQFTTAEARMNRIDAEGNEGDEWAAEMTLAPGEMAQFYVQKDGYCNDFGGTGCEANDFLLVSFDAGYSQWGEAAPQTYYLGHVKENQQFSVLENSAEGTVIGKIEGDTVGFFGVAGYDPDYFRNFSFVMMGAAMGNAVVVEEDGAIVVANADAIDYELNQEITVKVALRDGNQTSATEEVTIKVMNTNDVAPVQEVVLEDVAVTDGDAVEISLAGVFSDAEGDALMLTVEGLPNGLSFDETTMMITGSVVGAGSFTVTVIADDGVNQTEATINFAVAEQAVPATDSDSGSFGFGLPLLGYLMWRRRRN